MSQEWITELNEAQRRAVTFGDGPLLIIAGAGTGKTRTLACRVAHLIEQGVSPERILLLTFTRRAAGEMISRAGRLTTAGTVGQVWGGTFHAIANRLLRIYGRALGLDPDFTVMDQSDAADLMNLIRNELGFGSAERRFPRKTTLVSIYSHTVNAQKKLRPVLKKQFPWCEDDADAIAEIFREYARRKRGRNVLDYDDLLLFWRALAKDEQTGKLIGGRFDHVLVDEYQDTNALQSDILRGMRRAKKNICAVGDDAQSIYSFRAATVRNMLDFSEHFPGTETITLEQNYRSGMAILNASNAVMEYAKERYTKNLWSSRPAGQKPQLLTCQDENHQTVAVCEQILTHLEAGVPLMQQAVLVRAGHHSASLEVELTRRNIPFHKFGGLKFVEAAHVKDLLAILRILENPADEISWFRVLHLFSGVGPKTARKIMDALGVTSRDERAVRDGRRDDVVGGEVSVSGADADEHAAEDAPRGPGGTLRESLRLLLEVPPLVPDAAAEVFEGLRDVVAACRGVSVSKPASNGKATGKAWQVESLGNEPPLASQVERIRKFYEPICEHAYDNPTIRLRDIEQLEQIAARYRSRRSFITDLTLDPPNATSDFAQPPHLDEDWLTISTIHSAKGCEWQVVHVMHAADGMIPSDMATSDDESIDEERRLFYVAMTRAKDNLYIYFPLRYYQRRMSDRHTYAQLTRFVPPQIRGLFEEQVAGGTIDEVVDDQIRLKDIDNALDDLWD